VSARTLSPADWRKPAAGWALTAALLLSGWLFIDNGFHLRVLIVAGLFTIVVMPLDLMVGYMGYLPFGQAAFYGTGAYIVGNLTTRAGQSFWVGLIVVVVVLGASAWMLSAPLFRLTGAHFAIGTLAVGQLATMMFGQWEWLTGGTFGTVGIARPQIGGFAFDTNSRFYLLVAFFVFITAFGSWLITRGRAGLALRAIRQDEVLAAARGLDVTRCKRLVFVWAAVCAGVAGALFAPLQAAIDPSSFTVQLSMLFVLITILGGTGTLIGPALGAVIYMVLDQAIQGFAEWNQLVLGVLLVVIVLFLKGGLWGAIRTVVELVGRVVRRAPSEGQAQPEPALSKVGS